MTQTKETRILGILLAWLVGILGVILLVALSGCSLPVSPVDTEEPAALAPADTTCIPGLGKVYEPPGPTDEGAFTDFFCNH